MKRLLLASLLLLPVCAAEARFDAPAFLNACLADLTLQFTKDPRVSIDSISSGLAGKFRRMCRCAANKTLNISVQPESVGMTAAALKSVSDTALFTCIPEQPDIVN